ncbi:MAG: hypothetical protein BM485_00590 [Desulfobulbaceae bacterium DB1]|nr:MAG: hypothetical protein BM485_00590 [Desulfobulbaceae bacterium DB1]
MYTRDNEQIWLKAPRADNTTTKGVWVYPGEIIEWHYTCTPLGTLVTGYTVKPSRIDNKLEKKMV